MVRSAERIASSMAGKISQPLRSTSMWLPWRSGAIGQRLHHAGEVGRARGGRVLQLEALAGGPVVLGRLEGVDAGEPEAADDGGPAPEYGRLARSLPSFAPRWRPATSHRTGSASMATAGAG